MSQMSLRKMRSIALAHLLLVLFAQGEATKKLLNLPDQIAFDPTFDTTGYNQEPYSDDLLSGLLLTNPFQEDSLLDADSLYNEIYEPEEGPLSYMPVFETPLNLFSDEFLPNDITDENRYDLGDLMQGYEEKNPRRFEKRRPSFGHAFVGKRRPSFGHAFVGKRRPSFGHAFVGKRRPSFGHAFVGKRDADGVEEEGDEFEKRQPRTYGHTFVGKRTTAVNPGYGHDFIGKRSVEQPDEQSNEQAVATQFSENKRVPGYGHDFVVKRSVNDEHASIHKRSVDSAVDVERDSEYADSYMDKRQSGHAFVGKRTTAVNPGYGHDFIGKRSVEQPDEQSNEQAVATQFSENKRVPGYGHDFVVKRSVNDEHASIHKRSVDSAVDVERDSEYADSYMDKRQSGHAFVGKRTTAVNPGYGHDFIGKRSVEQPDEQSNEQAVATQFSENKRVPGYGHDFVVKRSVNDEHASIHKRSVDSAVDVERDSEYADSYMDKRQSGHAFVGKRRPSFGHAFVGKRRPSFGHAFVGKRRPSFGHAFVGKRRPSFGHAFVGKRDADGMEEEGDEFEKRQPRTDGHTFVGKRTTAVNPGYGHDFIGKRSVEQPDEQSNEQAVATQFSENKRVPGYGHDFVVKRSVNDEHASIHKRSMDSAVDVERDSEYADSYMDKRQSGHAFVGKRRPSFGHAFVGKRRPSFGHAFVGKRRPSFGHAFVGKRRPSFGHAFVGKRDPLFGHAFVEKRRPSFGHAFVGKRRPSFGHAFVGKRRPSFGHAFVGKRIPRFEHAFVGKRSDEDDTIPGEIVNSEHPFLSKENSHEADQAHEAEVPYPRTDESFASSKREAKNSVSDT